jgi:nucleoside-diphosphate-sugar epimerase
MASASKDVYLVIGGSGFLGRHVVNALLGRGDTVSVFDIVQRYHDIPFYNGDITEQKSISEALSKVRTGILRFSKRLAENLLRAARRVSSTPLPRLMVWTTTHYTGESTSRAPRL